MKVSTDACIQGAWTPVEVSMERVLDIGAGTGLLSLMLASKNERINIHAVEIDKNAAEQAEQNVNNSPWADRIEVIPVDIKRYRKKKRPYDMIITNPPFFNNSLLSTDDATNIAKHTQHFKYGDLLHAIDVHMKEDGYASILLPVKEFTKWEEYLLCSGWSINSKLYIHPREGKEANRVVALISLVKRDYHEEHLYIRRKESDEYTDQFIQLMKPYYLNL